MKNNYYLVSREDTDYNHSSKWYVVKQHDDLTYEEGTLHDFKINKVSFTVGNIKPRGRKNVYLFPTMKDAKKASKLFDDIYDIHAFKVMKVK